MSPEEARKLAQEERITLIRQGSLILDEHRQAEYLAGVIPVLNKEELDEAMAIILLAHDRGHGTAGLGCFVAANRTRGSR